MVAQVLAVPIVLVSNNTPSHPHLGHAVVTKTEFVGKKGCFRFRQKAVEISNLLREALGMPLIKISNHHGPSDQGKVRLLPFIGTSSNTFVPAHGQDAGGAIKIISIEAPDGRHHRHHAHGRHRHHRHHHGKGSFINRIHHSIMNLGRWEGRAVAFVLGKIFQSFFFFKKKNVYFFECLPINQAAELEFYSGCSLSWVLSRTAL